MQNERDLIGKRSRIVSSSATTSSTVHSPTSCTHVTHTNNTVPSTSQSVTIQNAKLESNGLQPMDTESNTTELPNDLKDCKVGESLQNFEFHNCYSNNRFFFNIL